MSQWARSVYPHSFPATATVKMTMITMTKMTKMTMTTMKMVFADDNDKDTDDIIDNVDVDHPRKEKSGKPCHGMQRRPFFQEKDAFETMFWNGAPFVIQSLGRNI